jgi:glycosyltransferase involved in cell wall biosynthesis
MKISILTPDLSNNCLGRAYLLAKILQRHYEAEIVGPIFGDGIWGPVADDKSVKYKPIVVTGRFKTYRQIWKLIKRTTGDVIYASKPLFSSYDAGLLKKWLSQRPLLLDIDDWQLGLLLNSHEGTQLAKGRSKVRLFKDSFESFMRWPDHSYWWTALNEKLTRFANRITVSSTFLKEKFGGTIVWHARDTTFFDPDRFDMNSLREKYEIGKREKTVIFCGTPRPHKGIDDLITALKQITKVLLIIIGINEEKYCQELILRAKRELGKERIRTFETQPFSEIPQFLAMSDIVVIPQTKGYETIGQIPAKVFDAMAMAKPIIATNVSDLPEILGDCGWLVEPGQPEELAGAIQYVLNSTEEAKAKGQKARDQCKAKYSYDAMEEVLCGLFNEYA